MSAFVIPEGTMDTVVQLLTTENGLELGPLLTAACAKDPDELGRFLYRMNVEAVSQRYPGKQQEMVAYAAPGFLEAGEDDMGRYVFHKHAAYNPARGAAAVRCLRYQCAEGNIFGSPLYLELNQLTEELLARFKGKPAFENAPWTVEREKIPVPDCEAGMHSWVARAGRLSKHYRCTLCGEPYGDPT